LRILVVGATGFLGSYVLRSCKQKSIIAFGSSTSPNNNQDLLTIDFTQTHEVKSVVSKSMVDCIINCAAITNVDECERNPELARSVNATGPKLLAEICNSTGIRLIHVSTDSVFDGESGGYLEDSVPNPINVYARNKLEAERLISKSMKNYVIARTNLYGLNPNGKHLLNWILSCLVNDKEMVGFEDAIFNPLWVRDLAECLVELASNCSYAGTLHCAGDETFSKYEFIKRIAWYLGYHNAKIKKGLSSDVTTTLAKRPNRTYLSNSKMKELLKTKIHILGEVMQDSSFDIYRSKELKKI